VEDLENEKTYKEMMSIWWWNSRKR